MHEQRKEDGSLVLNPSRDRAHTIIEESMLKANKAVTHTLMWDRGVEAMYRVHPQPTPDQWSKALREIQELDGVSIPGDAWGDDPRKAVNAALETAPDRQLNKIQRAVLKVMPRAKYMNDPFGGHHALNFDIYGHFTSPIRRLSDTINHWIVHENDVPENILELCDHASDKQKDGETAERLYKQFLQEQGLDPTRSTTAGSKSLRTPRKRSTRSEGPRRDRSEDSTEYEPLGVVGVPAVSPAASRAERLRPREGAEGRDTREDEKELSWSRSGEDRPRERSAQRAETEDPEVRVAERIPRASLGE